MNTENKDFQLLSFIAKALEPAINRAVSNALQEFKKPVPDDDLIHIDEAAKFIGKSKSTVYILSSKGLIPKGKRGNRLYFSKKALRAWIMDKGNNGESD